METRILKFEENEITFQLSKDNGMMINATIRQKLTTETVSEMRELFE
jgi:hypothetical protein